MPYKDPEKEKERQRGRKAYFKSYQRRAKPKTANWYFAELEGIEILQGSERVHKGDTDLIWEGKRVDVKMAHLLPNNGWTGWRFNVKTQKHKADYFLCLCRDDDNVTKHVFLIPNDEIKAATGIGIESNTFGNYAKFQLQKGGMPL